ncbi:hypothetical protein ES703_56402 [subsurface metagenome]
MLTETVPDQVITYATKKKVQELWKTGIFKRFSLHIRQQFIGLIYFSSQATI